MKTVLDKANAFIGHEKEVDEGYETTMRRNAFVAGYEEGYAKSCELTHDFALLVYKMRKAQKVAERAMAESDDYSEVSILVNNAEDWEAKVDTWLKENYEHFNEEENESTKL